MPFLSNESPLANSPANPNIIAVGANDYCMVTVFEDSCLGFYISDDGGATWFNTMVPGLTQESGHLTWIQRENPLLL